MSETYGHIICVKNCTGKAREIVEALNRFIWNSDKELFQYEGDSIFIDSLVQYPSIFPQRMIYLDFNGQAVDVHDPSFDDLINPDWEIDVGDDIELEELVKTIAPVLGEGEIIISVNAREGDHSMSSGQLTIRSDMTGKSHFSEISTDGYNRNETSEYP